MRVTSGKFRGRKLFAPEGNSVRPTSDRVKEAIFNRLRPTIEGSVWIDFFCGSGGIGIEALSNGAKEVCFVDQEKASAELTQKNLQLLGLKQQVFLSDAQAAARSLLLKGFTADVIYCDPPYKGGYEANITQWTEPLLKQDGVLMVEHGKGVDVPCGNLILTDVRHYGISEISTFRKPRLAVVTGTFDPFTLGHRYLVEQALKSYDSVRVVLLINPDKTMKYSLEKRLEIAKESLSDCDSRVTVDSFDGMTADYCKQHNASVIVRGFRDAKDLAYETEMAEFNEKTCGVPTVFFEAERKEVSSTVVRERVTQGQSVDGYVAEQVKKEL